MLQLFTTNRFAYQRTVLMAACSVALLSPAYVPAQPAHERYYAHPTVEDEHGVISSWYRGLNGPCDFRARVAADTMKRYPWATPKASMPAPDYIYSGRWQIDADGTIHPQSLNDWANGDLVQRGAYSMMGWVGYYRYMGDPAAIAHIHMTAEVILRNCLTSADHPWPRFPISVPNRGEPYSKARPEGMMQIDLASFFGLALTRGYEITGTKEWFDMARHWADLLAEKRSRKPGAPPWNRYANPEHAFWNDLQTGGIVMVLYFLDEVIRCGYKGDHGQIVEARDAGRSYLRDTLLPRWLNNDTWAREYWDWEHDVQGESFSEMVPRYMMRNPDIFPNWALDSRNIASLYLHRSSVSPKSMGDVYSGAWAYPEGSQCCDLSLSYAPMQVGPAFAEHGVRTGTEWGRELARRQFLLATYDSHPTGVVEDGLRGGQVVAGNWFQIAHPLPLHYVLEGIAWLPVELGANRENHIVRCSSVVKRVRYEKGAVAFETFDAPAHTTSVLRLSFEPSSVEANGKKLKPRLKLDGNGYALQKLLNGDCILTIRHDRATKLAVRGTDPQSCSDDAALTYSGEWQKSDSPDAFAGTIRTTSSEGASVSLTFWGNQVRVMANTSPEGGRADVYIDEVKQLCGIDYWNPLRLGQQIVFSASGLSQGEHKIRIVAKGKGNPWSNGAVISVDAVQFSNASGEAGRGEGGGPGDAQRWIFGYPERTDYVDSKGNSWRPATEFVQRAGHLSDPVQTNWFVLPRRQFVAGTADPDIYRHGIQAKDFAAYFTVRPGTYHVRVRLMESRITDPAERALNIEINGQPVAQNIDIAATAAGRPAKPVFTHSGRSFWEGLYTAVDLVFDDIKPSHGVIAVRFVGQKGEALVSAVEIAPGKGAPGATPIPAS